MAGHNFKALQTFRAWSETLNTYVFGSLINNRFILIEKTVDGIDDWIEDCDFYEVAPESIGIFTGKDDKNGTPIFAGLPEDGNIGCDALYDDGLFLGYARYDDGKSIFSGSFYLADEEGYSTDEAFEDEYKSCEWHASVEVDGTQYEQHLKETKC